MTIFFQVRQWITLAAVAILTLGCGSGTDPLSALNATEANNLPQITIPFASTTLGSITSLTPYSSNLDGFRFSCGGFCGALSITAPYNGVITSTDSSSVTIYHTARVSTRISGIVPNVVAGAVVETGSLIGTSSSNTNIAATLSVLFDGTSVCPYFFLTRGQSTQRTWINTLVATSGQSPCS